MKSFLQKLWPSEKEAERIPPVLSEVPIFRHLPLRQTDPRTLWERAFEAANVDRLTADWTPFSMATPNQEIFRALEKLRLRSRDLERNNPFFKKFLRSLTKNVVGPDGIRLQMRVRGKSKPGVTRLDVGANRKIEEAFTRWSKRGVCTACGQFSFASLQRMSLRRVARDGEIILRILRGFNNKFKFALQVIDPTLLDVRLNIPRGGSAAGIRLAETHDIRMGIERDEWEKPVAYYILQSDPNDQRYPSGGNYLRIEAKDIIHIKLDEDGYGVRGVPWLMAGMLSLKMLDAYMEAELVASRIGASQVGFYKQPLDAGEQEIGERADPNSALMETVAPGVFKTLPPGFDIAKFDPAHPADAFGDFVKNILRAVAASLDVGYHTLTGDLEEVNYSSLRQGSLDERDGWRVLQKWFVEALTEAVFSAWLDTVLAFTSEISLPYSQIEKFDAASWQVRGWQWVDPQKEISASIDAVSLGVKSRTDICAEQGRDFSEVLEQLAEENRLAAAKGVNITPNSQNDLAAIVDDDEADCATEDETQSEVDDDET